MDGVFYPEVGQEAEGADDAARARSRDSLFLLARLSLSDRSTARDVRVRNLSSGGLMAEYEGPVAIGEPVVVDLRGIGEVRGRIAWATEGRIGVALDEQIDPKKARKPVASRAGKR